MTVTASQVIEGFHRILGREPESEQTIAAHLGLEDVRALYLVLLRSQEFRARYSHLRPPPLARDLALDEPRVVFLHIPKCGGTTMRGILARHFDEARICPELFNNLGTWTIDEARRFQLFSGHFDYESCRALPGENTKIITMLREPKRRLLSFYYYLKSHRREVARRENLELALLAREMAPEVFFEHPAIVNHPYVRDCLVRAFADRLPQGRFETVTTAPVDNPLRHRRQEMVERAWCAIQGLAGFGLLEEFDRSLIVLGLALNLALNPIAPRMMLEQVVKSPRHEPVERRPVTTALDAQLDRLTRLDQALYGRAVGLFRDRAHRLNPSHAPGVTGREQ